MNTITDVVAVASKTTLAVAGSSSDTSATYQSAHEEALRTATYNPSDDRTGLLYERQVALAILKDHSAWLTKKQNRDMLIQMIQGVGQQSFSSVSE